MQTEMAFLGPTTPQMHQHPDAEIRACKTFPQAVRRALMHAGMTQEAAAARIPISEAGMSMLMSGKREWTVAKFRKLIRITGSAAPLQWLAISEGATIHIDELAVREARANAELAEVAALRAA